MTAQEQRENARQFYYTWKNRGNEKSDSQTFWSNLLRDVLKMEHIEERVVFEKTVIVDGQTKFIDVYIPESKVLIEQKSIDKKLDNPIKQSGGEELTPYQQAKRYSDNLPFDEKPRWIVLSNFSEIRIHNMNSRQPEKDFESIFLKDIQSEFHRLNFLIKEEEKINSKEVEISVQAGDIVGLIYDALLEQYADKTNPESLKSLNKLCVRIVFCLYAEDSGIFDTHLMFHDYMNQFEAKNWRNALIELFKVLDTKIENRDTYLNDDLASFPYVNGGLFADENIEIPKITDKIRNLILEKGCGFDWSKISPTIFGAVFESTLNPETRRSGGMHYTSIENIHKVIDPLFLDDLKAELEEIKVIPILGKRKDRLYKFQQKLASLKFLDPACGSGNFLTETYTSLRKLENEVIRNLIDLRKGETQGQIIFGFDDFTPIEVSISQFYGIEINDFAVTVAKTALWIAEHQMMKETENVVHMQMDFLPLKTNAFIIEGNALRIDWEDIVTKNDLDYIMGNPPFSAGRRMGKFQREDMNTIAAEFPKNGDMDYVCLWYIKATRYMQNTHIKAGFVSTSSITQGEQVMLLWKILFTEYNLDIFYAVRSFKWESEAKIKAGVHCVIILFTVGFSEINKYIINKNSKQKVRYINGYLLDAKDIWIEGQKNPICNVPNINNGSKPLDNAICAFTPEEKKEFISKEPKSFPYFYRYMGSREFINNIERWFLIINKIPPHELAHMPLVINKLKEIKEYRLSSSSIQTKKLAETPAKFHFENMPQTDYLVIPQTSSGRRRYIPIGFLTPNVMVNNKLQIMKNGGLYEFGILSSNVHNSWVRCVAGRFREDFTYSVSVVYNTFPWCNPTPEQKEKIEKTAQGILDARALYPDSSLADLYDELTMPKELRKAHQKNDIAVMKAYGFDIKATTEESCVEELMKMYQKLVSDENSQKDKAVNRENVKV